MELRPIADILADLKEPVDEKYLETREQGGQELTYIPWYYVNLILDQVAVFWEKDIEITTTPDRIFVTCAITIHASDGKFTRKATGTELLKEDKQIWVNKKPVLDEHGRNATEKKEIAYGDPSSNAESMAFRRAAANFGLGRYLYFKEEKVKQTQSQKPNQTPKATQTKTFSQPTSKNPYESNGNGKLDTSDKPLNESQCAKVTELAAKQLSQITEDATLRKVVLNTILINDGFVAKDKPINGNGLYKEVKQARYAELCEKLQDTARLTTIADTTKKTLDGIPL